MPLARTPKGRGLYGGEHGGKLGPLGEPSPISPATTASIFKPVIFMHFFAAANIGLARPQNTPG